MPQLDLYIWFLNSCFVFFFFCLLHFIIFKFLLLKVSKTFYIRKFFIKLCLYSELYMSKFEVIFNKGNFFFFADFINLVRKKNFFLTKKFNSLLFYWSKYLSIKSIKFLFSKIEIFLNFKFFFYKFLYDYLLLLMKKYYINNILTKELCEKSLYLYKIFRIKND